MLQMKDIKQPSSIDYDCTICQREKYFPLNSRLCDSCKGWNDLTHVMECLEPEYPHIDPKRFGYRFGAEDDKSIDQSTSIGDCDQDLGSLIYRPLDHYSSSMACMLCCRIDEAIRISISPNHALRLACGDLSVFSQGLCVTTERLSQLRTSQWRRMETSSQ
jgi:hypothetical protein